MEHANMRKHERIGTTNLVAYLCLDEAERGAKGGMGRTLNVSEGGILLETHQPVDRYATVSLTIAMEDEVVEIKGRVAYSKKREDGRFETGVQFLEGDARKTHFLKQYITLFQGEV